MRLALILSLVGNIGLGLLLWHASKLAAPKVADTQLSGQALRTPSDSAAGQNSIQRAAAVAAEGERPNIRSLVDKLYACGLSRSDVRRAVKAKLDQELDDEGDKIESAKPYYKRGLSSEEIAYIHGLQDKRDKLLVELFGPDGASTLSPARLARDYGRIPTDKIPAVERIRRDYNDMIAVVARDNTVQPAEKAKKLEYLKSSMGADIAGVLSEAELREYNLRRSSEATKLSSTMGALVESEEEFEKLYDISAAVTKKFGTSTASPVASYRAQNEFDVAARSILGDERFIKYAAANDLTMGQIGRAVSSYNIDPGKLYQVAYLQRQVASGQVSAASGAEQIRHLLGPAFERYTDTTIGSWVKRTSLRK